MRFILKGIIWLSDCIFHWKNHCILLPHCKNDYFYIQDTTYQGEEVTLENDIIVKKGDRILELHMNNQRMKQVNSVKQIVVAMKEMMEAFAILLKEEKYQSVKAICGNTLLSAITTRYGFETMEAKETTKQVSLWENLIRYAYGEKNKKVENRVPVDIWFARDNLLDRYGEKKGKA